MAAFGVAAGQVDYGLDAPGIVKDMFVRGGWFLAFGLALWFMNHVDFPGPAMSLLTALGLVGLAFVAVGAVMVWSSRTAKLTLRDEILDAAGIKGDEKILDAGCGRGLLLIGAAKRLKSGRATGVDLWDARDQKDNSSESTRENAKLEGVADKVRVESGDVRKLVYPEANFDVVLSNLVVHNLSGADEREQAIREMYRVLKPGGRLAMYDILKTREYAKVLESCGAQNVTLGSMRWLWMVPGWMLTAKK
jgi:cyclopropane fatty-acyl-phospholipid synthase-like methyltransferase